MRFSFTPPIKALVLDMDGVLWRGDQPIGNLPAIFQRIEELGLQVMMATNNSTLTPENFASKLAKLGVRVDPSQIVTSSEAAAYLLKKRFPEGGPVFVVGESGLQQCLAKQGFYPDEENVLAVVAGIDRQITYRKLAIATRLIRSGALFIGTNPDKTFPMPDGLIPGAGAILAAIQTASGVEPIIAGKPQPTILNQIMERLQVEAKQMLIVGDRLDTDIQWGQNAGCRTALVLSGIAKKEEAQIWSPPPDLIAANLTELLE